MIHESLHYFETDCSDCTGERGERAESPNTFTDSQCRDAGTETGCPLLSPLPYSTVTLHCWGNIALLGLHCIVDVVVTLHCHAW